MEGFVSNEWGRFRFFPVAMAAAAATPMGPVWKEIKVSSWRSQNTIESVQKPQNHQTNNAHYQ